MREKLKQDWHRFCLEGSVLAAGCIDEFLPESRLLDMPDSTAGQKVVGDVESCRRNIHDAATVS